MVRIALRPTLFVAALPAVMSLLLVSSSVTFAQDEPVPSPAMPEIAPMPDDVAPMPPEPVAPEVIAPEPFIPEVIVPEVKPPPGPAG